MLIPRTWDEIPEELRAFLFDAIIEMESPRVEVGSTVSDYTRKQTVVLRWRERTYHVEFFEEVS